MIIKVKVIVHLIEYNEIRGAELTPLGLIGVDIDREGGTLFSIHG